MMAKRAHKLSSHKLSSHKLSRTGAAAALVFGVGTISATTASASTTSGSLSINFKAIGPASDRENPEPGQGRSRHFPYRPQRPFALCLQ